MTQPYDPQQGHNPYRPLGAQDPAHVSIDQFQQPKKSSAWIVWVVVAAVVAGLAIAAWQVAKTPINPVSTPTPTPSQAPSKDTKAPSVDPTANGVPFHSTRDDADGYWKIDKVEWTSEELLVTMTIQVTKGTFNYTFFAIDNKTAEDYDPTSDDPDGMNAGSINEGESRSGVVKFRKNRYDTTVILATSSGRQITALVAKG